MKSGSTVVNACLRANSHEHNFIPKFDTGTAAALDSSVFLLRSDRTSFLRNEKHCGCYDHLVGILALLSLPHPWNELNVLGVGDGSVVEPAP